MTMAERGRFCASCQKTVTDFTALSDKEIINILNTPQAGGHCGRFQKAQLEQKYFEENTAHPFSFLLLKRIAASFLFFQTIVTHLSAQTVRSKAPQQQNTTGTDSAYKQQSIWGCVTDAITNAPLPGITVSIAGTDIEAITDVYGYYRLSLPDTFSLRSFTLRALYATWVGDYAPAGTAILDEKVNMDSLHFSSEVNLYRYPVNVPLRENITAYRKPIIESWTLGGINYIRMPWWKWKLHRIFRRRRHYE